MVEFMKTGLYAAKRPCQPLLTHFVPMFSSESKGYYVAERVGFEPTVRLHVHRFSRPAHSTTLAPLHITLKILVFLKKKTFKIQMLFFFMFNL